MDKKCFICTENVCQILGFTNPSSKVSFQLGKIFGIPTQNLEQIGGQNLFDEIVYCATCLERILYIQDILQELERLGQTLREEKYLLESKLKETTSGAKTKCLDIANSVTATHSHSENCAQHLRVAFVAEIWKEGIGIGHGLEHEPGETGEFGSIKNDPIRKEFNSQVPALLDLHMKSEMVQNLVNLQSTTESASDPLGQDDVVVEDSNSYSSRDEDEPGFVVQDYNMDMTDAKTNSSQKKCNLCDKTFATNYALRSHILSVHEIYKLNCTYCNYEGQTESDMTYHLSLHAKNPDKGSREYQCRHCSQKFNLLIPYQNHLRISHPQGKSKKQTPKKCEDCGKILSSNSSWKIHVLGFHKKEFRCKCPHCDYGCHYPRDLNRHVRCVHKDKFSGS